MESKCQDLNLNKLPSPLLNFLKFSQQIKHRSHPNKCWDQKRNSLDGEMFQMKEIKRKDGVLQFRANRIQYLDRQGNVIDDSDPKNLKDIFDFKVVPILEIPANHIHASPIVPKLTAPNHADLEVIAKSNEQLTIPNEIDKLKDLNPPQSQKFLVRESNMNCSSSFIKMLFLFIMICILCSDPLQHNAVQRQSGIFYSMEKDPIIINYQTKKDVPEMQPVQLTNQQIDKIQSTINKETKNGIQLGMRLLSIQQVEDIRYEFKQNWLSVENRAKPINKRNRIKMITQEQSYQ